MRIPCPTCHRKGRVPKIFDGPMSYYNPHTGESWPHETCQTCMGSGWVNDSNPAKTDAEVQIERFASDRGGEHG